MDEKRNSSENTTTHSDDSTVFAILIDAKPTITIFRHPTAQNNVSQHDNPMNPVSVRECFGTKHRLAKSAI